MNAKIKVLILSSLLLSEFLIESHSVCEEPCEPTSLFCGGYVGSNFNFGSINFLSKQCNFTELDMTYVSSSDGRSYTVIERGDDAVGTRRAINSLGAGLTFGWDWSNPWLYLAAEFDGIFYGNPCKDLCDESCGINGCNRSLSNGDAKQSINGGDFIKDPHLNFERYYKSNVRLDGIVKIGFLAGPRTVFYLLGGGSGLFITYKQSIGIDDKDTPIIVQNNPVDEYCCTKLIGGGTIGFGMKVSWCKCFDLLVEGRYARYLNWCSSSQQPNVVSPAFISPIGAEVTPGDIAVETQTTFRTDSYLALVGLNWHF